MYKNLALIFFICISLLGCDKKKSGISGKVINPVTGEGVYNALVSFVQCESNGTDCKEIVIGQVYTSQSGEFVIDKRVASKSKTKWITVSKDNKKLAQKDNVGLNDKNIVIEVNP
jgi:hypothetical protein